MVMKRNRNVELLEAVVMNVINGKGLCDSATGSTLKLVFDSSDKKREEVVKKILSEMGVMADVSTIVSLSNVTVQQPIPLARVIAKSNRRVSSIPIPTTAPKRSRLECPSVPEVPESTRTVYIKTEPVDSAFVEGEEARAGPEVKTEPPDDGIFIVHVGGDESPTQMMTDVPKEERKLDGPSTIAEADRKDAAQMVANHLLNRNRVAFNPVEFRENLLVKKFIDATKLIFEKFSGLSRPLIYLCK